MSKHTVSNRRSFLKGGALVAAPLAAAAAPAVASALDLRDARLARLEDEAAIRELHQAWLRRFNAGERAGLDGAVRSLAADYGGEPDMVELSADRRSAEARYGLSVELHSALPEDNTLAQMAHAQGCGHVSWTERRVLRASYMKAGDDWAIARLELEPPRG